MNPLQINACCYCGSPAEGHYSICRDGMGVGPEVPLCDRCGGSKWPSSGEIWGRIALASSHPCAFYPLRCLAS